MRTPFSDFYRDKHQWLFAGGRMYVVRGRRRKSTEATSLYIAGREVGLEESVRVEFLERYFKERNPQGQNQEESNATLPSSGRNLLSGLARHSSKIFLAYDHPQSSGVNAQSSEGMVRMSDQTEDTKLCWNTILDKPMLFGKGRGIYFGLSSEANRGDEEFLLQIGEDWYRGEGIIDCRALEERLQKEVYQNGLESKGDGDWQSGGDQQEGLIRVGEDEEGFLFLKMVLEPFIIRKRGRYHVFDAAHLKLDVYRTEPGISFPGPVEVTLPYEHPFLYSTGRICYGPSLRFSRRGVKFSEIYLNIEDASRAASILFHEARKTLQSGYLVGVNPVTPLSHFNQLSEEEALSSGLKIFRQ